MSEPKPKQHRNTKIVQFSLEAAEVAMLDEIKQKIPESLGNASWIARRAIRDLHAKVMRPKK